MKNVGAFKNLAELKKVNTDVKNQLGPKYTEVVNPFIEIIKMVMKANNENEFQAMLRIKNTLPIYHKPDAPMLFSSALIDITESKHFQLFRG